MKTSKSYLSILTLIAFFVIGMASNPEKGTFSDAATWIPVDFNPNNTILLIETHPRNTNQNTKMTEWLEKNYPYRYEVVDRSVIQNKAGKYSDTKIYQFGILWKFKSSERTSIDAQGKMNSSSEYNLFGNFIDRSTNKSYPSTTKRNVYGLDGYMPFFHSILNKFK